MMTSVIRTLAAAGIAAAAAALSVSGSGNALASVVTCDGCRGDQSGPHVTYNQSGDQRGQDGADVQGSYRVDGNGSGSGTVQGGQGGSGIGGDGWNHGNYSTGPGTQHTVQGQGQDGADGRVEMRTDKSA